ncbi:MAG TPA: hypothetical protein VD905_17815 [Flavobacteriales bacterium]|nr:hypothetical protein [Flavobacteriales bacterium]
MDKNARIWKWSTIVMLLCNLGLMLFILLRPAAAPPHHPGHGNGPHALDRFIVEELGLTNEQEVKYKALKKAHRTKINVLLKIGRNMRTTFFTELKKDKLSDSLILTKAKAIGLNQEAIELITYSHFQLLRELLTDTQKKMFDGLIMEVLHRMAQQPCTSCQSLSTSLSTGILKYFCNMHTVSAYICFQVPRAWLFSFENALNNR